MNAIDKVFVELKAAGKTALIPFISVGDPDLDTTVDIVKALEQAGADIIELGVPYSDPLADGPVIQKASERALRNKVTLLDCINVAERLQDEGVRMPLILFSYYNPVLQYGLESFFELVASKGISGMIIPDLPIEESESVLPLADAAGVHLIPLVAPVSRERIVRIVENARGFVYCVSSLGVTGVRSEFHNGIDEFLSTVREATDCPIAVGFGISSRDQVARFQQQCDGVIVGSAIVRKIEEAIPLLQSPGTKEQGISDITQFVASLKV